MWPGLCSTRCLAICCWGVRQTTLSVDGRAREFTDSASPFSSLFTFLCLLETWFCWSQVSTWFANARRRLKKENKMTWSPRNRPGEDDEDLDDDPVSPGPTQHDSPDPTITLIKDGASPLTISTPPLSLALQGSRRRQYRAWANVWDGLTQVWWGDSPTTQQAPPLPLVTPRGRSLPAHVRGNMCVGK